MEELLAERGITVNHVTVYRWVQRLTPEFIEAARLCRHAPGDRWFADEMYVKVAGRWNYLHRAIDQHGQSHAGSRRAENAETATSWARSAGCGVDPGLLQDLPYRRRRYLHSQASQFAVDPAVAPSGILPGQPEARVWMFWWVAGRPVLPLLDRAAQRRRRMSRCQRRIVSGVTRSRVPGGGHSVSLWPGSRGVPGPPVQFRAAWLPPLQDDELVDQDLSGLLRLLTSGQPQP